MHGVCVGCVHGKCVWVCVCVVCVCGGVTAILLTGH